MEQEATEYQIVSGVLVIRVQGELDHHLSKEIRKNTEEIINEKEIRNLVFDFEHTTFMDSSGIGLIMGRYKAVREFGGDIYLIGVKEHIQKILLYSGLYKITRPCVNLDDVIKQVKEKERVK